MKTSEKDFQTVVWKGHQAGINGVAWAPLNKTINKNDSEYFASVANDKKIKFWKLNSSPICGETLKLVKSYSTINKQINKGAYILVTVAIIRLLSLNL